MVIGAKIRNLRLKLGLTQEELALRCELTKGYISQLENDLASPSIATLIDILNVLGESLESFFVTKKEEQIVFNKEDFFSSINCDGENIWLVPNSQKHEMEPIILELPEGGRSENRTPFEGEEFGYVLQGRIALVLKEKKHKVKKGSAFYLSGDKTHYIENDGKGIARILWITTPSNF